MIIQDYLLWCLLLSGARGFQMDPSNEPFLAVPTSSSTKLPALGQSFAACIEKSNHVANPYSTDIFFYFATESTVPIAQNTINDLKTFLYYIIHSIIEWCPEHRHQQNASQPDSETDNSNKTHGIIDIGLDSIDLMDGCKYKSLPMDDKGCSFSDIIHNDSLPLKLGTCEDADVEISTGNSCAIFQCKLSLYTSEQYSEIQTYTDFIHANIRRIVDKGMLLSDALPSLKSTRWLGNSLQYFECSSIAYTDSFPEPEHLANANNDTLPTIDKPQKSSPKDDTREEVDKSPSSQPLDIKSTLQTRGAEVLLLTIWCLILVGFGIFLLLRTRRRISILLLNRRRESAWNDVCSIPDYYGTGDPPASYHYGRYHFMITGERFLSTRCESCLETLYQDFYSPPHDSFSKHRGVLA